MPCSVALARLAAASPVLMTVRDSRSAWSRCHWAISGSKAAQGPHGLEDRMVLRFQAEEETLVAFAVARAADPA